MKDCNEIHDNFKLQPAERSFVEKSIKRKPTLGLIDNKGELQAFLFGIDFGKKIDFF